MSLDKSSFADLHRDIQNTPSTNIQTFDSLHEAYVFASLYRAANPRRSNYQQNPKNICSSPVRPHNKEFKHHKKPFSPNHGNRPQTAEPVPRTNVSTTKHCKYHPHSTTHNTSECRSKGKAKSNNQSKEIGIVEYEIGALSIFHDMDELADTTSLPSLSNTNIESTEDQFKTTHSENIEWITIFTFLLLAATVIMNILWSIASTVLNFQGPTRYEKLIPSLKTVELRWILQIPCLLFTSSKRNIMSLNDVTLLLGGALGTAQAVSRVVQGVARGTWVVLGTVAAHLITSCSLSCSNGLSNSLRCFAICWYFTNCCWDGLQPSELLGLYVGKDESSTSSRCIFALILGKWNMLIMVKCLGPWVKLIPLVTCHSIDGGGDQDELLPMQ